MGQTYEIINDRLRKFIAQQPIFFVATAPLTGDGHVNLSPKGRDGTLLVLDEQTIAYLDFGGSHAETLAHLRENGRITLMWCAFDGPPKILRVHGRGEPLFRDDARFDELAEHFGGAAVRPGLRAIVLVKAVKISDSCGFAVPYMEFKQERPLHYDYFGRMTEEEFNAYCERKEHNAVSIDGLPALPLPLPPRA